jgi:two-component system sensor histidine kinase/response regulator
MAESSNIRGTILVVDDLPTNREIMSRILARNEYDVVVAEDGIRALELLPNVMPDLVLLDINMPKLDGFTVCQRIKADEATAHIPVIFISALSELGDKVRAFEAGAVDYIIKPFKVEEVLARVNSQMMLAQQRRQILQLNDLKDQIIRTVSHDLKNPIHIVMGYAALMIDSDEIPQSQVIEMASQIYKSADKMFRLVTNLLDLTQIEDGIQWEFRHVSLAGILEDVLQEHALMAKQKEIRLMLDLPKEPITLYVEPMRLHQVFTNLVSNAIKYTPEGGLVRCDAIVHEDVVEIRVEDNGMGIPEEDLPNLFQKFYRVNMIEHKEQEGTGLGLSIAKAIIDEHGGQIYVESRLGQGSLFTVVLPVSQ